MPRRSLPSRPLLRQPPIAWPPSSSPPYPPIPLPMTAVTNATAGRLRDCTASRPAFCLGQIAAGSLPPRLLLPMHQDLVRYAHRALRASIPIPPRPLYPAAFYAFYFQDIPHPECALGLVRCPASACSCVDSSFVFSFCPTQPRHTPARSAKPRSAR